MYVGNPWTYTTVTVMHGDLLTYTLEAVILSDIDILLQSFPLPLFMLPSFEMIYTKVCQKSTQMTVTVAL